LRIGQAKDNCQIKATTRGDFQIRLRRRKEKKRRSQPKVISGTSRGAVLLFQTFAETKENREKLVYFWGEIQTARVNLWPIH
jgi:hypothetical protein